MPQLASFISQKEKRETRTVRQAIQQTELCSGRPTVLLRDLLTFREEWTMCLPANLSLLKALLLMVRLKKIVRFTTTQEHVILGVRIIRLHLALHQPTKLLCNKTYTISWLICGVYILDQGYSRGNRFTVLFSLQNDICDLFKLFKTEHT